METESLKRRFFIRYRYDLFRVFSSFDNNKNYSVAKNKKSNEFSLQLYC